MSAAATDSPSNGAAPDPVRRFYDQLPFNRWRDSRSAAEIIRRGHGLETYPDFVALLRTMPAGQPITHVADCGCGCGWLSATLAFEHGLSVLGIDFSTTALLDARRLAAELGIEGHVHWCQADLLTLDLAERFDLVTSLGVLHHTADPRAAFERIRRLVRPGGYIYLGLYHQPGRQPFLRHFRELVDTRGVAAAHRAFRGLASDLHLEDDHLWSWFRDQVLHPRESQHTLREVVSWLRATDCELLSTSINGFRPFDRVEPLFAMEQAYAERSQQALRDRRFFPGFFTVLARG